MTGSEPANTTVSTGDEDKSREIERQQMKEKECDRLSEGSASPTDAAKLPLPASYDKSLSSNDSSSTSLESSPSPELKPDSSCAPNLSIKIKVGGLDSLHSCSKAAGLKMKRTVSNCNVRNTSTLCSKESSYVYHCPTRKRTQQQNRSHTKVPDAPPAPMSSMDAMASQFHLMLLEDSTSDDTQSMVELGNQPFRARGLYGSSLRRGESRNGHTSLRTTQHGTNAIGVDHLQSGRKVVATKQPTKQPANHRHPLHQQTSHMALERVHSVCGRQTAQIPGVQQEQLLLGHPQSSLPGQHILQQPRPFTHQPHTPTHQPHQHQQHLHPLTYQHRPMIGHRSGGSSITKPHPLHNGQHMPRGLSRVLSAQVPHIKSPAYLALNNKVKLHIPSGRKMESLV